MGKQTINVGAVANDGTGDPLRAALVKVNGNFTEVYSGAHIDAASAKVAPVDADVLPLIDSAASNSLKKVTWANIKATLKSYLDTLYEAAGAVASHASSIAAHGATGAVVGTTNAQTLTNKTLNGVVGLGVGVASPNELVEIGAAGGARVSISNGAGANRLEFFIQAPHAGASYGRIFCYDRGANGPRNILLQDAGGNVGIGPTSFGTNANNVLAIYEGTAPASTVANVGQLYLQGGALKFRGASGTVTTIAPA